MVRRAALLLCSCCALFAVADDREWQLVREDKSRHIQVFTREQLDSPYHEFYATTEVMQNTDTVVAVLSDVSAWPQWVARLGKVQLLKKQGDSNWVYVVYRLPYPFIERDAILYSTLKRATNKTISIRSVMANNYAWPVIEKRRVHLQALNSRWQLTPLANGGTRIELWGSTQPSGFMPALLFNYNLADEPQQTLRLLRQMLLRSQYQRSTQ